MLFHSTRLHFLVPLLAIAVGAMAIPARSQDSSPSSVPVFINDFELFSSAVAPPPDPNAKKPPAKDAPPAVFELSDDPSVQARRLMDYFSITLVQAFQKAGFTASRQQTIVRPDNGVLLRGVFAESDASNRIRRAMLGGGTPGAKLLLYVGTFNLARPDQPLYETAMVQSPDSRYGPVITVNNFIPMVKFELSKNPTEDEVRRICDQLVLNLTTLLRTNPDAFSK
jgi:Domain of unknown function (DUF4410)